jgi:hypothetical protein
MDPFEWMNCFLNVHYWPKWARITFVLLIPVTGPLWLAMAAILFCAFFIVAFTTIVLQFFIGIWRGKKETSNG